MERTIMYNCLLLPQTGEAISNGILMFEHANPVLPPDLIGYSGSFGAPGAPSLTEPLAEDALVDMEGCTLLPGLIDLMCVLEPEQPESPYHDALTAYRAAGNALNRGTMAIGCSDLPAVRAVRDIGERYLLWTPEMVLQKELPRKDDYHVFCGVPEADTPEEAEYLAQVRQAAAAGERPAIATCLAPDAVVSGLPALVRAAQLLVKGGYSNEQAVAAVTVNNAVLLGIDLRTGSLQKGLEGDCMAVIGNPLEDITALANPRLIARGGRLTWSHLKGFDRIRFALAPPGCPQ